jgi:hypothetical protein
MHVKKKLNGQILQHHAFRNMSLQGQDFATIWFWKPEPSTKATLQRHAFRNRAFK